MTPRIHSSPYRPAAASPPACSGATVSTRNGSRSIAAVPAAPRPAATCSAVSSSSAWDPIVLQNGASDSAAARAPSRSPASTRVCSSDSAHCDPASARAANARSRGHTPTAARRYHRSSVLPQSRLRAGAERQQQLADRYSRLLDPQSSRAEVAELLAAELPDSIVAGVMAEMRMSLGVPPEEVAETARLMLASAPEPPGAGALAVAAWVAHRIGDEDA